MPRSAWLPLIDEPLPEHGVGAEAVLATLRDVVIRRGLRIGHPGFTSWVTTAPTTIATAAHLAQAVASPQRWWLQPGNHIDSMAVRWLLELLGFPPSFVGTFTSGGSTANLVGLGAARQHAGERIGIDPAADGIEGIPSPRVYASPETHHVVTRAMGVLGIGRASIRLLDLDAGRRADLRQLRAFIAEDLAAGRTPIAVVGNAGDVNTGIVDPLPEMAAIAHEHGIWFHVDGAYGGWGMLDERVEDAYGDRGAYDSFAVDPHKWLAAPVGTGFAVCRDGELLSRAFTIEPGHYDRERRGVIDDGSDAPSPWVSTGSGTPDWGVDFSTPARGIAVWAVLKEIGAEGMRERVRRHNDFARDGRRPGAPGAGARAARRAAAVDLLLPLPTRRLGRCRAARRAQRDILAELRREGRSLPSSTRVNDALRHPCLLHQPAQRPRARRAARRRRARASAAGWRPPTPDAARTACAARLTAATDRSPDDQAATPRRSRRGPARVAPQQRCSTGASSQSRSRGDAVGQLRGADVARRRGAG